MVGSLIKGKVSDPIGKRRLVMTGVLESAIERMDRARGLLTKGNPTPTRNWGMLDTTDLKKVLDERDAFVEYLTQTLIPDLRESGSDATADDFETCVRYMR
jgi:hypothetical protein